MKSCRWTYRRLGRYARGALKEGARRAAEGHLAACSSCRGEEKRLEAFELLLSDAVPTRTGREADSGLSWDDFRPLLRDAAREERGRGVIEGARVRIMEEIEPRMAMRASAAAYFLRRAAVPVLGMLAAVFAYCAMERQERTAPSSLPAGAEQPASSLVIRIQFQPGESSRPSGYYADAGGGVKIVSLNREHFSYGWR